MNVCCNNSTQKKDSHFNSDTTVNRISSSAPNAELEKMFYENKYLEITNFKPSLYSQGDTGIYASALIDCNKYVEAQGLLSRYAPKSYYRTANDIDVPIYSENLNQYLFFSLLKVYAFSKGLANEDIVELYVKNFNTYDVSSLDQRLYDYIKSEYLFSDIFKDLPRLNNKNRLLEELIVIKEKYPSYRRLDNLLMICKELKDSTISFSLYNSLFENDSNYQRQYFEKLMMESWFKVNSKDQELANMIVENFRAKFPNVCFVDLLRYLYTKGRVDSIYANECVLCNKFSSNIDSVRSKLYTSIYLFEIGQYDSLNIVLKQYRYNNKTIYSFSELKDNERDMFSVIELKMLLKQKKFKNFVDLLLKVKNNHILNITSNGLERYEEIKRVTYYLYEQNKESSSGFELYFKQNINPFLGSVSNGNVSN